MCALQKANSLKNELLNTYDNLEIIHFCYSTPMENWKKYIKKYDSKGIHFYLDKAHYRQYQKEFDLGYAPRYVLLNENNEVICWHCANPNQEEIRGLIAMKE